ncbi:MAG: hypothetical protein K2N87_12060 [Eubacterium sp.]|nr:hypothetical protein [Eubacterium sp.]
MSETLFRERYHSLNAQVVLPETLRQDVIRRAARLEKKRTDTGRKSARRWKGWKGWKAAIALASVCVCLYAAMPVLAASSDSIYRLMYLVSPQIAQHFMPVQKSDVSNGVKMEVVSASVHGDTAQVYITMQDLEGSRIDETIDLYDSYSINLPFDCMCHCERAGYDESTKTATFLITVSQFGKKKISGDKITFTVGTFLSGKKTYEQLLIPISLADVQDAGKVQQVPLIGMGITDEKWMDKMDAEWNDSHRQMTAMVPQEPMQQFPLSGKDEISLTGIGYVDGMLHIQTAVTDPLETDNHGFFYLKDSSGRRIEGAYSFTFTEQNSDGVRVDYYNEVFEVSKEELAGYELYGDFFITGTKTDGDWRVTFALEDAASK